MRLPMSVVILFAAAIVESSIAAPCFCLQDDDDRLWYDCIEYKGNSEIHCIGQNDRSRKERAKVENGHQLTRIANGTAPCIECQVIGLNPGSIPRPIGPASSVPDASSKAGTDAHD